MTAEYLYVLIQNALEATGLSWREKDKLNVRFEENAIVFSYGDMEIRYKAKPE